MQSKKCLIFFEKCVILILLKNAPENDRGKIRTVCMNFIDKLNMLMENRGIKRSDLSRGSGLSYTTIDGLYKKGFDNMKLQTLKSIADYFEVSIDYLVNDDFIEIEGADSEEQRLLAKYRELDDMGRRAVNTELNSHYDRVMRVREKLSSGEYIDIPYYDDKVAAGTGYQLNDGGYSLMRVARTRQTDRADFVVTVSGASMEPEFFDGDNVLVHAQPDVYEGEVGIFVVNGNGYIKKKGKDRLISVNRKYKDIFVNDYDEFYCAGKIVGKLEDDEILN